MNDGENHIVKPLLSVLIITYNHEKYISDAIESVLMQKCQYPVEIIIGDDFSSDKTREICSDYAQKFSNIKLLPSEKNIGITPNFIRTSQACTGKYIAMLEGDDYWTDPYKLQKQVDYLIANPEFILCFHNRNHQEGNVISDKLHCDYGQEKHFIQDEILFARIHTLTVMFRNILKEHPFPKEFSGLPLYDFALWAYLSLFGKAAYLDFVGATYRLHDKGFYSAGETISNYEKWLNCQIVIKKYFPKNYQESYNKFILMLNHMLLEELSERKLWGKYSLNMIKLFYRSILAGNYQYINYYNSFFKTKAKRAIKYLIGIKS